MNMTIKTALFTLLASSARPALAQSPVQVNVSGTWQLSADNGVTWTPGTLSVNPAQARVLARLTFAWTPLGSSPPEHFTAARFDATVRSLNGAGSADFVSGMSMLSAGWYQAAPSFIVAQRTATDLIKIDRGDLLEPGAGDHIQVGNSPVTGNIVWGNPVQVFDYTLNLDGSTGTRVFSGVFATTVASPVSVAVQVPPGSTIVPVFQPATLVVVPGPGVVVTLGACGLVIARRRR